MVSGAAPSGVIAGAGQADRLWRVRLTKEGSGRLPSLFVVHALSGGVSLWQCRASFQL